MPTLLGLEFFIRSYKTTFKKIFLVRSFMDRFDKRFTNVKVLLICFIVITFTKIVLTPHFWAR